MKGGEWQRSTRRGGDSRRGAAAVATPPSRPHTPASLPPLIARPRHAPPAEPSTAAGVPVCVVMWRRHSTLQTHVLCADGISSSFCVG